MKRILSLFLFTSLLLGAVLTAALPVAAAGAQDNLPCYPDTNPYWIVFYDDTRDDVVLLTARVTLTEGQELQLSWGSYLKTLEPVTVTEAAAYALDGNVWEPLYSYEPPANYVQRVVATNINVYDNLGHIYALGISYQAFLGRVTDLKEDAEQTLQGILGIYDGFYSAPQGETGLTLSLHNKAQLLANTTLLEHYAHIASFCSTDDTGAPQQIFSAQDIRDIISLCTTPFVALFNFFPTTADSDVEEGLYAMSVEYDIYTGTFDLVGEQWIQHDTYQMADLRNVRVVDDQLTGDVWGEHSSFFVTEYIKVGQASAKRGTAENGYRIEFTDDTIELAACDTAELRVIVKNEEGDPAQANAEILWSSSDPNVARINGKNWGTSGYTHATATVTGASAGVAVITAQLSNGRTAKCTVTVTGDGQLEVESAIAVFSTEKSLSVKTGGSMRIAFGSIRNGEIDSEWKKMAVTVSNPALISLSPYQKTDYGYVLDIKGLQQGQTHVTITDTETGASTVLQIGVYDVFAKSYSYSIDAMPTFYPTYGHDAQIETNIYNLNGLYVNQYRAVKDDDGDYYVSFHAYNTKYHIAAVDIFDAAGEWVNSVPIDKFSEMTSLWEVGEQALALVTDISHGKLLSYEQKAYSKKTEVRFEVPAGGHFTITNNMRESIGVSLYNIFDLLYTGAISLMSPVEAPEKPVKPGDFYEILKKGFKENPTLKKELVKLLTGTFKEDLVKLGKGVTTDLLGDAARDLFNSFEDVLRQINFDWKRVGDTVFSGGEKLFEKYGGTAGKALKECFDLNKSVNFKLQFLQFLRALDDPYVTVYTKIENGYINPQGVVVQTDGNVDAEAVLQVFRIDESGAADGLPTSSEKDYTLYNISFVKNDDLVQPDDTVKVYIPIPDGLKGDSCTVYRQEEDGYWMPLQAHVEGNYLVFETEHFSLYAVSGDTMLLSISTLPSKLEYQVGELLNTEGLRLLRGSEEITSGFICDPCVLSEAGMMEITVRYGDAATSYQVNVKAPTPEAPPAQNDQEENHPPSANDTTQDTQPQSHAKLNNPPLALAAVGLLILFLGGAAILVIKKRR